MLKCDEAALYFTYVLQSEADGMFYVGYSQNVQRRFEQHSKGEVESTRDRRPLSLIYYEACVSQEDAIRRERYLKTHYGKMFLRKRLKSFFAK